MAVIAKTFSSKALALLAAAALVVPAASAFANQDSEPSMHPHGEAETEVETIALTPEQVDASRALFQQYSCGACHVLSDAGGSGSIGPALDGNANLSVDYVKQILNNGQGAMPSFGGMMDAEQLDTLAAYVVAVKE